MTSKMLFETLDSSKKMFWLQLESNSGLHACQFAALTTRPSGPNFWKILKNTVNVSMNFFTSSRTKIVEDSIAIASRYFSEKVGKQTKSVKTTNILVQTSWQHVPNQEHFLLFLFFFSLLLRPCLPLPLSSFLPSFLPSFAVNDKTKTKQQRNPTKC